MMKKTKLLSFATRATVGSALVLWGLIGYAAAQSQVADTRFDHDRGFYDAPFSLAITSETAGATIRFTTDGSLPSSTHGRVYATPIPISGTAVIRAMAYQSGMVSTDVDTQTYLFAEDVLQQPYSIPGWPNTSYLLGSGGSAIHDYEMDPAIVDDPAYTNDIRMGLREIPTISVVMPFDDFWAVNDTDVERRASAEILYPDGSSEQVDCGLVGHSHKRLKRSYRLAFRREFGAGMFDSKIFRTAPENGDTAAGSYNRILLRGGNNRAWSRGWNPDTTCFTRDQWYRDTQVAMSGIGSRGTFAHLYVNGVYWGLYNACERTDGAYSASYMGGDEADWYAVNHGGAQGGEPARWNYVKNTLPGMDMAQASNYENASAYLEMPLYCDYLIASWMTGVQDWPQNNWWGGNRNNPPGPFMYYGWDCEWALGITSKGSFEGAWVHPNFRSGTNSTQTIATLWHALRVNDEFMTLFADRVYQHCFNDGAVSDDRSRARWAALNNYIRNAVVAESAKWGDAAPGETRTRDGLWQAEVNKVDGFFNGNAAQFLAALRVEGYYPSYDPPLFKDAGTVIEVPRIEVTSGFQLTMDNPDGSNQGSIYYTTDGSDPRGTGGVIGASAIDAGDLATISIGQTTTVKARVRRSNSDWSALHELVLFVNEDRSGLKVTEIMYNPPPETMATGRGVLSIVGDAGTLNPGDYERALVEFEATLPGELTADDLVVIRGAANPSNNGTYTISKVVYEGTEDSTRTRKVLLTEPLVTESGSPAVADFLYDGDRFEFVELKNTGPGALDLSGIAFTRGLPLALPDTTELPPGGFAVVARYPWNLAQRYPGLSTTATFPGGSLDNAGENLELSFATGERFPVDAIVPEAGRTRLQFASLPSGLGPTDGFRLYGAADPAGNGLYDILSVSNNSIRITDVLNTEGAGAWVVFHEPLSRTDYNDRPPWPMAADGYGYSLVPTNAHPGGDPNVASSWRASSAVNGSPGADDPAAGATPPILVNEVLTHTDAPQRDAIELYNPTGQPVDLGGWFLTDDNDTPQEYVIPSGQTVPALGYLTLYEGHYVGTNLVADSDEFGSGFSLSSLGDQVYLLSPTLNYAHGFGFDAAANGVSFGRYLTSEGKEHFPAQTGFTADAANNGPAVGPVVISEIMYHPDTGDHEFIELVNISGATVNLYDPSNPGTTWKVSGVGFTFPANNVQLSPGEVLLLVRDTITPAAFRARYGISGTVQVFNYDGALSNDGEALTLKRPDEPLATGPNAGEVGYIVVDKVRYNDNLPWPETADGGGFSLERITLSAYGNDPVNWQASVLTGGTPGLAEAPDEPALGVDPSSFNLSVWEGQSPSSRVFSVWNAGREILDYQVADNAAWLSVTPAAGNSTGSADRVTHTLTFSPLGPGTHEASVSLTSSNALNSPLNLPVVVTVTSNTAPRITQLQVGAIPVVVNQPVAFNSTVIDDASPGRPLTLTWAATQKPFGATVTFTPSATTPDPELVFDTAGSYTVALTASDTQYAAVSSVVVDVVANLPQTEEVRVLFSEDDAEEHQDGTSEGVDSSDLEMVQESDTQIVGIRFRNVGIPAGAVIAHAEAVFAAKESGTSETHLQIRGQRSTNAAAFTATQFDISARPVTTATVPWTDVPAWTAGSSGPAQTAPDLASIIQELVDQPGWSDTSPVVFIISGTGKRTAWSFDGGGVNQAPLLRVEYLVGVVSPDQDGDGMEDAWEIAYFGSTNAANGGATDDFDDDNVFNIHELWSGTDPTNEISRLTLAGVEPIDGGEARITWQSVDGKSYSVLSSSDLMLPEWSTVTSGVAGVAPVNAWTVTVGQADAYYRISLD